MKGLKTLDAGLWLDSWYFVSYFSLGFVMIMAESLFVDFTSFFFVAFNASPAYVAFCTLVLP